MPGTYHFYVDDYRFRRLWSAPDDLLLTDCQVVIEPNFSIYKTTAPAEAIWRIYQKRTLARYWQEHGIKVIVDLNVPEPHLSVLGFLGVPRGWRAYATHGCDSLLHETYDEHEQACEHAGTDDILFVVYGGGRQTCDLCYQEDWLWIKEYRDELKRRELHGKQIEGERWWQRRWRGW